MSQTKAQLVGGVGISTVGDLTVYGGVNVSGVLTATSFDGAVSGDATGLTGTPNITVGFITATGASISGNVSIGGTLTYEDVTNVDSVGLITARSGIILTGGDATLGTGVTISGSTANVFTLSTNGSERVRVSSAGSFGIGTTNPPLKLTVVGNIKAGYEAATGLVLGLAPSGVPTNDINSYILWGDDTTFGGNNGDLVYIPRTSTGASHRFYTGSTTPTERLRIAGTGAFGLSGANYGTSGQVLTSQGSGSAPQWATPSGGAWQFISSVTANNSASVAFTSGIDSTYDVYVITFTKVTPATNDNLLFLRTSSNGGSSYDSGGTDYVTVGSDNAAELIVSYDIRNVVSTGGANGTIHIFNAGDSGRYTQFNFEGVKYRRDISNEIQIGSQGIRKSAAVVNAIQFFANSNLTTGTFRLYGIKNS